MQCTDGERAAPERETKGAASVRCSRRVEVAFANDHQTTGDDGWHLLPCNSDRTTPVTGSPSTSPRRSTSHYYHLGL